MIKSGLLLLISLFTGLQLFFSEPGFAGSRKTTRPVDLVFPQLDTENSRWIFFSSACRPFGMVNLSPDTNASGDWGSGYRYEKDSIKFFSHIHGWQLSGIPVMPVNGPFNGHLGSGVYGSRYSHEKEIVKPGYHAVFLEKYGIKTELTSTTRVGFHRIHYPNAEESYLLLDLGTVLGPSGTLKAKAEKVSETEIQGYVVMDKTSRRPKPVQIYFTIQFNTPFEKMLAWKDGKLTGETSLFENSKGGVYLKFNTKTAKTVLMKAAISYVSEEQAKLNLQTELPHWNFDKVVGESANEWNKWLSRIEIKGGTPEQQKRFYTDLWHSLLGRRIISDVNGKYCDMTGAERRIGQIPPDKNGKPAFNHHNSDSFWGAQWTISTLWSLVYPEVTSDFVNSMLLMYADGGLIPRGPAGGNYTAVMTGASSTPFMVGAYMKGIRDFDVEKAFEGLKKNHLPGGMMGKAGYEHYSAIGGGIEYYMDKGFVPFPLLPKAGIHQDGASQTLEYASQDWCLAQLAYKLGKNQDFDYFIKRSENWKNLYDAQSGWIRPKNKEGQWKEPFDPYQYENGFVEANGAQATWFVPHDLPGLAEKMGGNEKAAAKLNQSFETASKLNFTSGTSHDKELHPEYQRIPINYGNQPSIQTAFVFNHIGYPWLTQYWSRRVVNQAFSGLSTSSGYNGDEDQGLMGALAVLMKIGIFEMNSGCEQRPLVELGSPVFDKIVLHLNKNYYTGKKFTILVKNNSQQNPYIQSARLNGKKLDSQWMYHDQLVKGGKLVLELGNKPNEKFNRQYQQFIF